VVGKDCAVLVVATVKKAVAPGLVKLGSVENSKSPHPPVPLGLMVPLSTALVLVIEVAARVVTAVPPLLADVAKVRTDPYWVTLVLELKKTILK